MKGDSWRRKTGRAARTGVAAWVSRIAWITVAATLPLVQSGGAYAQESTSLELSDGSEVPITRYPASGNTLLLWLPSEHGVQPSQAPIARQLAASGIEVWVVDLLSARFLPAVPSSIDQIPDSDIPQLINAARRQGGKAVYLLSNDRGAVPLLLGVRRWQLENPAGEALAGAVLITPNLYVQTPEVGSEADYLPIAGASNVPVFILQPALSPWRWRLGTLAARLEAGGSEVYTRVLPGVRDRFYFRPDATREEHATAERLARYVGQAVKLLSPLSGPREAVALEPDEHAERPGSGPRRLKPYGGDPQPPELRLDDLADRPQDLRAYRGRVVLVNFWASWCPPCVHEMPSMQALRERLEERRFAILAVNMAEDAATVRAFMNTMKLDFPVLLDRDGQALKRWRVFAFPTSYVIDRAGRIRFGIYGAIQWDDPEVVETLLRLTREPSETLPP